MPNYTEEKSFEIDQEIARSFLVSKKANFVENQSRKFPPYADFKSKDLVYMNVPPKAEYLKKPNIPV